MAKSKNEIIANELKTQISRINEIIANDVYSRREIVHKLLDPRRDIDDECGYPKAHELIAEHYNLMYEREAVAARAVQIFPVESWKTYPAIFETDNANEETEFEKAYKALNKDFNRSWFNVQENEGSSIFQYMKRLDILSGIGSYGVMLLGLNDGEDLTKPVEPSENLKLIYLRVFDEYLAQINTFENDPTNPRYGFPLSYNLTFSNYEQVRSDKAASNHTIPNVHWTRIIHTADNREASEIFGVPRMREIWNRLCDLRKLYGGSAEMYWRGAFPGLAFESDPSLGGEIEVDASALKDHIQEYMNSLQRYLLLNGLSVKTLAPQVVDPSPQIDKQLEAICLKLGVPKRIFLGSERGELASSQDSDAWNTRIKERQMSHLIPNIICPFIDRLIEFKVLPEPTEGYRVDWGDAINTTELDKATIAQKKTDTLLKYIQGDIQQLISPMDFLTTVFGLTIDEAEGILESSLLQENNDNIMLIEEEEEEGVEDEKSV